MEEEKFQELIKEYILKNLKIKIETETDFKGDEAVTLVTASLHFESYDNKPFSTYETTIYN